MVDIGAFEAKTHFSKLLERVEQGETIRITKRGKPAAMLVPIEADEPTVDELIERVLSSDATLGETTARELIDEGRL